VIHVNLTYSYIINYVFLLVLIHIQIKMENVLNVLALTVEDVKQKTQELVKYVSTVKFYLKETVLMNVPKDSLPLIKREIKDVKNVIVYVQVVQKLVIVTPARMD
jgi:hypothetical protein